MRRSDQRRDAVFACYQRDVTGRPLDELVADSRPLHQELAAGVEAAPRRARRGDRRPRQGLGAGADRAAGAQRDAGGAVRDRASRRADRGRDRRGDRDRQGVLRRRRARASSTACSARSPASGRGSGEPAARDLRAAAARSPASSRATRPTTPAPPSSTHEAAELSAGGGRGGQPPHARGRDPSMTTPFRCAFCGHRWHKAHRKP